MDQNQIEFSEARDTPNQQLIEEEEKQDLNLKAKASDDYQQRMMNLEKAKPI